MKVSGHIEELRFRLIYILTCIGICSIISYLYKDIVLDFYIQPSLDLNLEFVHTKPYDKILAYIKVSFYSGLILSFPVLIYNILTYILPALYYTEKILLYILLFAGFILFMIGALSTYYIFAPTTLKFCISFDSTYTDIQNIKNNIILNSKKNNLKINIDDNTRDFLIKNLYQRIYLLEKYIYTKSISINSLININYYIDWLLFYIIVCGIIFQLPIFIIILYIFNIIEYNNLKQARPYIVVISLFVAAVITPPDIISQIMIFIPIILLYELSIVLVRLLKTLIKK